jgi:quercetin dioxygenase-like cupin family protein
VVEFLRAGTVFEDSQTGERTEVLASPAETGDRYRVRLTLHPGSSGPERHRHPGLTEEFIVRSGRVGFRLGRGDTVLGAGEMRRAARGTTHALWNAGDGPAEIDVDIVFEPPRPRSSADIVRFGAMYADLARGGRRPGLLQVAMLLDEFSEAYALPVPPAVQSAIVRPLAAIARWRGHRIVGPTE